jgi:hypothetical protein
MENSYGLLNANMGKDRRVSWWGKTWTTRHTKGLRAKDNYSLYQRHSPEKHGSSDDTEQKRIIPVDLLCFMASAHRPLWTCPAPRNETSGRMLVQDHFLCYVCFCPFACRVVHVVPDHESLLSFCTLAYLRRATGAGCGASSLPLGA